MGKAASVAMISVPTTMTDVYTSVLMKYVLNEPLTQASG